MKELMRLNWSKWCWVLGLVLALTPGCSKGKKIAGYLQRGDAYVAQGDFLKAEIEYLNAIRLDPANPQAIRQLGEVYFQQGNIQKAYLFLKRTADTGPADESLRLKLGRIYLTGHKLKEARDEANAVLQSKPDSDEALILYSQTAVTTNDLREAAIRLESLRPRIERTAGYHLAIGTLALRQDDLKRAEEAYAQALQINPKLSVAHELMANLALRRNNVVAAAQSLKTAADLSSPRSVTALRYVDFLRDTGDEAGALARLEELVKQAPDYLPASVLLAQMRFTRKDYDASSQILQRILAMDPMNYEATLINGRMKLVRGDPASGLADLEKLARIHAGVAAAHYNLAMAQLLNNDPNKALTSLNQAVNLDPDYTDALLLEAELNLRKGDAPPVIAKMTDLIRKRPQVGRAYILLAEAQALRGNNLEALAVYNRFTQAFPRNPQPLYLTGLLQRRLNRAADARQALTRASELAPDFYPASEQLVELDLEERKLPDALRRVQAELQKHPKAAGPLVLKAQIELAQTNVNQAEVTLRQALQTETNNAPATMLLAQIMTRTGRAQDALATLRQAAAGNAKDPALLMEVGMLESALNNPQAARKTYEDLLKIKPDFVSALNNLASLYSDHFNMPNEAYDLARKARELAPDNPIIADTLGWILYKRREYGWALPMLQQSAQKLPGEPEVAYHLGMVQSMMGDEAGARAALTRAVAAPQKYSGKDEATQRLQQLSLDVSQADPAAIARLEKQLADNPGDPIAAGRLAAIEERKGSYDKALAIYERAFTENKGNVGAMARAAKIYAEHLKNPKKALELAKAARQASPEDPAMAHILGAIAQSTGDSAWAAGLLLESNRKRPDDPDILYDLALAQYGAGQIIEAEASMQRAIGLGKPFPRLEAGRRWLTLSSLFKDPNRLKTSATAVGEWLKAEPDNPAVLMATGTLHELQNNAAAAEQTYNRLVSLYPGFHPASVRLATLLSSRTESLPQAQEIATRLRQARPDDPEVATLLGTIAYKRADFTRAAQLLAESSRKRASDPVVWYYLGLAHQQLKKPEDARRAFDRLLAIEPTGERATEARRILAELK